MNVIGAISFTRSNFLGIIPIQCEWSEKMRFVVIVSFLAVILSLTAFADPSTAANLYKYNPRTGKCVNKAGAQGLNKVNIQELLNTGGGECADLRGAYISAGRLLLTSFNLKGADLTNMKLAFSRFTTAQLMGTIIKNVTLDGYSDIDGKTDKFTALPSLGDTIKCTQTGPNEEYCHD